MNQEVPEVYREVFNLRDEVRLLRDQVRNDDEYLGLLVRAEEMSDDWRQRIEARRTWMRNVWPDIFKPRWKD